MNIIFFGSAKFGCESLKGLIEAGYKIPLVVTQADKQKGRGLKLGSTPIKELAQDARLRIFQPENVNASDSLSLLRSFNPDLFVIIAYGQKFSPELLAIPKIMPINVHASLLPKYRGAAPINWAIINGDRHTGNTIMQVIPQMDAGPIISQSRVAIEDTDDSLSLEEKLSQDARVLLLRAIKEIDAHNL
ncbi:MAG: methionyl-tRNA formyltransferase [Candidatus Omnitrophota bacterium]